MSDRRDFLATIPALLTADLWLPPMQAQTPVDADARAALDFWVSGMGVPRWELMAGESTGAKGLGNTTGNFAREPVFLHFDPKENAVIPVGEITPKHLTAETGDAQVDFQLQRLRLSPDDHRQFHRYSSGGIYLEMQQHEAAERGVNAELFVAMASSVFSAIFPSGGATGGKGKATPAAGGKTSSGAKPKGTAGAQTGSQSMLMAPARAVPLQQPKQAQSLPLPNGLGKAAFSAFAKDRQKSAFGQFIGALARLSAAETPYLQLLSLPLAAVPALAGLRTLVANLQLEGGDQAPIMQAPLTDVATTARALEQSPQALRLRTGSYIAVPREHTSGLKEKLKGLKVMNGFLVPKETADLDLFEAVSETLPDISYLCLDVKVRRAKLGNCAS